MAANIFVITIFFGIFFIYSVHGIEGAENKPPNILLIIADNLGHDDIGSFGNADAKTPNLDQLSNEGMKFTRMYSQPSSTSSRAAILTGILPARMMLSQGWSGFSDFISPAQNSGIHPSEHTIASLLHTKQYHNAFIGKWHLGYGPHGGFLPLENSYQSFYGIPLTHTDACSANPQSYTNDGYLFVLWLANWGISWTVLIVFLTTFRFFGLVSGKKMVIFIAVMVTVLGVVRLWFMITIANPMSCILMRNDQIIEQPYKEENMTLRFTQEAIEVVRKHSTLKDHPLFLTVSYIAPTIPCFTSKFFKGKTKSCYSDSVSELDWNIGQILDSMKKYKLDENLLVVFTSANGHITHHGYPYKPVSKKIMGFKQKTSKFRGGMGTELEGGLRVPTIIKWTGKIPENTQIEIQTTTMDIFPTIVKIVNPNRLKAIKRSRKIDGKSLLPLFEDPSISEHHNHIFHYCDSQVVGTITYEHLKISMFTGIDGLTCTGEHNNPPLIYNITADPREEHPLPPETYDELAFIITRDIFNHQASIDKDRFSFLDTIPWPWYFPCANFPYCSKTIDGDEEFSDLNLEQL
ncbi:unnamed protein product [Owenia fusiformis]|uniref:Sulfatase N-terminal domain-containing protein n=1 Tax=Owenia fusiformis TaxID=6347 RepID=A0A8S4PGU0_OWEFU|nr:unnamed protein product [Owenia fusiformis]